METTETLSLSRRRILTVLMFTFRGSLLGVDKSAIIEQVVNHRETSGGDLFFIKQQRQVEKWHYPYHNVTVTPPFPRSADDY